ncbi:MAG: PAS domain-containing protein [Pseudomonadota bacterium]
MRSNPYTDFVDSRLEPETREAAHEHSAVICLAGPGAPVVYVSDAFKAHTGYDSAEAVGRNLSFLHGPKTEPEAVDAFRQLMEAGQPGTIRITNYRKDRSTFVHECEMRPIRDEAGAITHFIAIQRPLSEADGAGD